MTHTNPSPLVTQCGFEVTRYPTDLAPLGIFWPVRDERQGRYIVAPFSRAEGFSLGVVDDFGNLVPVPCYCCPTGVIPMPTTGVMQ